jgi:hypothetical protein
MGPTDQVAAHAADFRRFVESVRFGQEKDQPISWTAPESWKRGKEVAFSYATFVLGAGDKPLQLTVTPVAGGGPNVVLDNVNRWRGQLGLAPVAAGDLDSVATPLTVAGASAHLVDMSGSGGPGMGRRS